MTGLRSHDVIELQKTYGKNEITDKKPVSYVSIFLHQFQSPITLLLIAAAVISLLLKETIDGVMIAAIVIINGIFGFIQEFKAEKAIEALKKMVTAKTRVIRDGKEQQIDAINLVPGDIILLEQGDRVPADAVLLESKNVEANEAILTGESIPVEKNTTDEQKKNILLGTHITRGHCTAQVTHTGMQTRFGSIASSLSSIEKDETPLEKRISKLGKVLGIMGVSSSIILFGIGLIRNHPITELLFTSISLAVAAVPEGLPAVITITLALGTQRMAKKKAILRKLAAIEALGSISIIATDKTGTLTKNEMKVTTFWTPEGRKTAEDPITGSDVLTKMLSISVLCNNASIETHQGKQVQLGDPTESALLMFAKQYDIDKATALGKGELVEEFEFDAGIKAMSVVYKPNGGSLVEILTKGAPEVVLEKSTRLFTQNGIQPLSNEYKAQIQEEYLAMASKGLRVIAFGYRTAHHISTDRTKEESELIFVGFSGLQDPPREEVKEAVQKAHLAGIRTIMITGDSPLTARAIGQEIGILSSDGGVLTGSELSQMEDEEVKSLLSKTSIFARTSPEDKLRLVRLLQDAGHTVSVTGDGVNDALALKQADVGVAMGITGSDVSKGAADMIVTDDNYATIVNAVEEGRTIYDNMKSSIKYLIGCNIGEVLSLLIAALIGWPMILTPLQILFINLVTDGLPALGLSAVPAHKSIMQRKPIQSNILFTKTDMRWFLERSVISVSIMLFAFAIGRQFGNLEIARTLAFTVSIAIQQFIYLDLQAKNDSIFKSFKKKSFLPLLGIIPLLVQLILIHMPFYQDIFELDTVPFPLLAVSLIAASIVLVVSEIKKRYGKSLSHHNEYTHV